MARVNPTAPAAPPSPPIQRGDRATFSQRVDATITYLTGAPAEIYGLAQATFTNAVDAFTNAGAAATSASNAAGSASAAATSASNAATSESNAAASATNAANSAAALIATSTSSNTLGTGNKTFTVQAGKQFVAGVRMVAVSPSNPAQSMSGPVVSYSGTTLVLGIDEVNGAGTLASWNLAVTGMRGAQGPQGPATAPGTFRNITIYSASGAVTIPATDFEIEIVGGPSGAAYGSASSSTQRGGSSGGYVRKRYTGATVGASGTLLLGSTGAPGTVGAAPTAGTASSFTLAGFTTLTAGGGTLTAGGTATGGDINIPGQRGGVRFQVGMGNNNNGLFEPDFVGGDGGSTPLGFGGRGELLAAGSNGTGYGAGAAAGSYDKNANATAPGIGSPAVMIMRH